MPAKPYNISSWNGQFSISKDSKTCSPKEQRYQIIYEKVVYNSPNHADENNNKIEEFTKYLLNLILKSCVYLKHYTLTVNHLPKDNLEACFFNSTCCSIFAEYEFNKHLFKYFSSLLILKVSFNRPRSYTAACKTPGQLHKSTKATRRMVRQRPYQIFIFTSVYLLKQFIKRHFKFTDSENSIIYWFIC